MSTMLALVPLNGMAKGYEQTPHRQSQSNDNPPRLFQLVPQSISRLDFINPIIDDHPMRRLYAGGFSSGGIAIGDVDGNSLPDIFLTNGPKPNKLFLQVGDMKFAEATPKEMIQPNETTWSSGAIFWDPDNDGDLDLYVCNYNSPNQLYINDGKGGFTEGAEKYGLAHTSSSLMAYPADYDLDGDLDLYLLCNRLYRAGGRPTKPPFEMVNGQPQVHPQFRQYFGFQRITEKTRKIVTIGQPDQLFKNNGKGYFENVTTKAGIHDTHHGLSATWYDYNQDNSPDLFVANDMNDVDKFYKNNQDGTFTDVTRSIVPHTTWFSMGSDIADVNNDGRIDYFCVDMAGSNHYLEKTTMGVMGERQWFIENNRPTQYMWNTLFLNTGTDKMLEAAYLAGIAKSDWSWAPKLADFDNDGWADLFVTNGMTRNYTHSDLPLDEKWLIGREEFDIYRNTPKKPDTNLAWKNQGNLQFQPTAKEWGLDHHGITFSAATADFDRDGNLDILTSNVDENVHLYRNTGGKSPANKVTLTLRGNTSNSHGIGATVKIQTPSKEITLYHNPFTGYISSNEPVLHAGLGADKVIQTLTIQWPNAAHTVQTVHNLPANQHYIIHEPPPRTGPEPRGTNSHPPLFKPVPLTSIRHQETPYDDYQHQPLLPYKHTHPGPGTAIGDINGDGRHDIFIGGATGQAAHLLVALPGGNSKLLRPPALVTDKKYEDTGALFIDIDADSDQDLYVASGSTETEHLQNRLYLNDGKGNFSKAPPNFLPKLPAQSSGALAACDYDRDGDLDLFSASRVLTRKYPLSPQSYLLDNSMGTFTQSPNLPETNLGMVTSAIWSDADDDGWPDLLLSTEWGPVQFFKNHQGKLVSLTKESGLAKYTGWWNSISGRDIDNDGDIDYAVTNLGLNTKYQASPGQPLVAYHGNFEGTGKPCFIEAQYEHNILFPIRGLSCSSHAMPGLAKKFPSYEAFAKATLPQIYPPKLLAKANRFTANTLESGIFFNDGKGNFTFHPLPRIAQISPGYGIQFTEIDGSPYPDLLIVQNFFPNQHETGRMDGGLGQLLLGSPNGFHEIWPGESGISLPGDHTALTQLDVNGDNRPDFLTAENNGHPTILLNQIQGHKRTFRVKLKGQPGNPHAIGAKVQIQTTPDAPIQTAEIYAGSGYLSQSAPELYFSAGQAKDLHQVNIRWPDGKTTKAANTPLKGYMEFSWKD